jgi:hypothetical protein
MERYSILVVYIKREEKDGEIQYSTAKQQRTSPSARKGLQPVVNQSPLAPP